MSYKSIFRNYIVLIALCLFVVIYIIINLDAVKKGDIYNGDLTKSILLTAIIILLIYLFVTWDDECDDYESENIPINYEQPKIKKFNLASINNNNNQSDNINKYLQMNNQVQNQMNNQVLNQLNNQMNNQIEQIPNKSNGESKYFILNQNTNQIKPPNPLLNLNQVRNPANRYDNPNIFISQKNMGKFGIKF